MKLQRAETALGLPTWGIVATVDVSPDLVVANAAHHLAAGAKEVHYYLDRDNPRTRALLDGVPGCFVTVCDDAYWMASRKGVAPEFHQVRQGENATHAREKSQVDYLLHLDADEFLWQREPLGEELALLKPGSFLQIGPLERVYTIYDDPDSLFTPTFRLPENLFTPERHDLTHDAEGLTLNGLTGHSIGKSAVPGGYGYRISVHHPHEQKQQGKKPPRVRSSECSILHYEGLTPLEWSYKLLRKAEAISTWEKAPASDTRLRQIAALLKEGRDLRSVLAMHDRLKRLTPERETALWEAGRLEKVEPEIEASVARFFPGKAVDLSAESYDRWLWRRERDLFAAYGLNG